MTNRYRIYVLDRNNCLLRTLDLITPDENVATRRARSELKGHGRDYAYELWQNTTAAKNGLRATWTLTAKGKRRKPHTVVRADALPQACHGRVGSNECSFARTFPQTRTVESVRESPSESKC